MLSVAKVAGYEHVTPVTGFYRGLCGATFFTSGLLCAQANSASWCRPRSCATLARYAFPLRGGLTQALSIKTMKYPYLKETPIWLCLVLLLLCVASIIPIINMAMLGSEALRLGKDSGLELDDLAQFGDFFGGHTSAFTGSLSLLVVLFFTFHQAKQQREFFVLQQQDSAKSAERVLFLDGINLITQWDISSSGCDQCLRLLDYYGRLALNSDDRELLLLLNTVITADIRANLQSKNGSFKATNYPYACCAIEAIRPLRESDARALKAANQKASETVK